MRPGSGSGVRFDNGGSVPEERQTFEGLYDADARWHDEERWEIVQMGGKGVGRGEGKKIDGGGTALLGL
jgi:hypothetical protein